MRKMRTKRIKWKKVEQSLNNSGLLTPPQAKKKKVIVDFINLNQNQTDPHLIQDKEAHQLSYKEFLDVFARESLRLTEYKSVKSASTFLKGSYIKMIVQAVRDDKDNVNQDGLEMIRFRAEYMSLVKKYCRDKKVTL